MKKFSQFLFLPLLLSTLLPLSASAQSPVIGDYDGDGTSDMSVALVDRSLNTTAYLTRLSNGASPLFWTWPGVAADAFASGRYFGDGKTYPAIVKVNSSETPLQWNFKRPDNTDLSLLYGFPGDSIPNHGPDFDGDGVSDIYVVKNGTPDFFPGFKVWYIALSGRPAPNVVRRVFGLTDDIVFGADINGDGADELVALRPSTYVWYSASVFATGIPDVIDNNQIAAVQWGLPGDIPLTPQDLNNDGHADYIISRRIGINQFAYVRYGSNTASVVPIGQATSIPMVGKFIANHVPKFAWHQRDTGFAAIRNSKDNLNIFRHGIPTNVIVRPDGTVVQPDDEGIVPRVASAPSAPEAPPASVAGCAASPGTKNAFRGDGDLWKPHSESTGKVVVLLPRSYNGASLVVLGRNGNEVARAERTHCCQHNGGRMHWWLSRDRNQLRAHAPLTVRVQRGATTECRVVPDPTRRYE